MKQYKIFSILGLLFSLVGMGLSFVLAQEYFGTASDAIGKACGVLGDGDSCAKVASSKYSSITLPVVGDIPIAIFGLMFYGVSATGFYFAFQAKEAGEAKGFFSFTLILSAIGEIVDMILLVISVSIIGTICPLCLATYFMTAAIIAISIVGIISSKNPEENLMSIVQKYPLENFKLKYFPYLAIAILLFGCGLAFARPSKGVHPPDRNGNPEVFQIKIKEYEAKELLKIDTANTPFLGDPKAPITIVKYADYNCGHCMHASHILRQIVAENSGLIKIYYKNFPLDGNCNRLLQRKSPDGSSCVAAAASLCANKQGKFYQVYSSLYEDNERGVRHTGPSVLAIAKQQQLDMSKFQSCMNSGETSAQIAKEVDEAEKLKIQSTPSIYVNNRALEPGTPDPGFLNALIKHLITKI
ncbi:MAG: thioredoxin domain-containing protein [Leptospiraceae bacterium]|nr:thioredoxin domain-containing protein [Leptospiraceae bacterium]